METSSELRQGLSQRQLNMIAIGGVGGAGLFVGSGFVVSKIGPSAFVTYAMCGATELFDELRRVDAQQQAEYFICVPVNPIDTGQADIGAVYVMDATGQAAQQRLDDMLGAMRDIGLRAQGARSAV